jgi:hypothetical protein
MGVESQQRIQTELLANLLHHQMGDLKLICNVLVYENLAFVFVVLQ